MKRSILSVFIVTLTLTIAVGCKKNPYGVTPLRGSPVALTGPDRQPPITETGSGRVPGNDDMQRRDVASPNGIAATDREKYKDWPTDREALKTQTVYFDLDSSVVKKSEYDKLKAVAAYLTSNPQHALLIEGHCDERGTEEYNRSLGERRALALREYLANSSVSSARILTETFGKDRPVDPGHDDAAWAKNRRGEFVVLLPKP